MNAAPLIRAERPADVSGVRAVLHDAFGGAAEAALVDRLRQDGDLVLRLVAEAPDGVAGYVAFPRLILDPGTGRVRVVGLAPVGVTSARQRQGIGSELIRTALALLKDRGERLVFVLGEPAYYGRFGFAAAERYRSAYSGPDFQVLELAPGAPEAGTVIYPKAFDGLG